MRCKSVFFPSESGPDTRIDGRLAKGQGRPVLSGAEGGLGCGTRNGDARFGAGRKVSAALTAEQSDDGGDGGDYADRAEPQMLVEGFEAFSHPQFHSLYLGSEAGHVGSEAGDVALEFGAEFGHVALEFGAEFGDVALEFGAEGSHIGSEFGDIGFGGDAVGKGGADGVGNGFGLRRGKASLGQGFGCVEGIKGGACHGAVFRWWGGAGAVPSALRLLLSFSTSSTAEKGTV